MRILRFVLPFLFVRNWHDGSWELSPARMVFAGLLCFLVVAGLVLVAILQAPVEYVRTP